MKKVIFVYPEKASFINLDITILSEKFKVIENTYNWKNKVAIPFTLIKQLFFLLKNVKSSEHIITSFGGYWSLLPVLIGKLYKKPTYIILHGTDCCAFEEINYGNIRKPILRYILKKSYANVTHLLPVSDSLIYTENTYFSGSKIIKQGYKHFFPKNNTRKTVIHNAIDFERWKILSNTTRKNNRFITVLSEGQFVRKGGEIIIEAAKKLPEFEFYFIGTKQPSSLLEPPSNIIFIPRTPPEELLKMYNEAKFYLQLSIFEGFGVATCEAMASGCIPIVSNVNMLPAIIGNSGYTLKHMEAESLVKLLNQAHLENSSKKGKEARQHIIQNFSVKNRQEKFFMVLEDELILKQ